jgi:hypothetical protein
MNYVKDLKRVLKPYNTAQNNIHGYSTFLQAGVASVSLGTTIYLFHYGIDPPQILQTFGVCTVLSVFYSGLFYRYYRVSAAQKTVQDAQKFIHDLNARLSELNLSDTCDKSVGTGEDQHDDKDDDEDDEGLDDNEEENVILINIMKHL